MRKIFAEIYWFLSEALSWVIFIVIFPIFVISGAFSKKVQIDIYNSILEKDDKEKP